MKDYPILEEMINLSKILPKQRNYSQLIYTFASGLFTIGLSAYNYVQSVLLLPDVRSVYRYMSDLMIIKPHMLTNLTYLPKILNEYKNITSNETITKESFILAMDALSATPFVNIQKNSQIIGLISNDIQIDEAILMEFSLKKFEDYIKKVSDKIVTSLFVYSLQPVNHSLPTFFIHILPANNGKANNVTTNKLKIIADICKKNGINVIGIATDGDTAMGKFHTQNIKLFESNKFDKNKNLLYFCNVLHLMKRGRYALLKMIYSKKDYLNKTEQLKNLFEIPYEVLDNASYTKMILWLSNYFLWII